MNMYKFSLALLIVICLFNSAFASESKKLIIAVNSMDYPPFEYTENKQIVGLHIDIVRAVALRKGLEVEFVQLPRKRASRMIQKGQIDGAIYIGESGTSNNSDLTWGHKGNGLSASAARLLVRKDSDLKYKGRSDDLAGLTIAVLRGFYYGEDLITQRKFKTFEADSVDQLKRLVLVGRADAAVVMQSEWFDYKRNGSEAFKILSLPIAKTWEWLGFSRIKHSEQFSLDFAKEMQSFLNSSEYYELVVKYYN